MYRGYELLTWESRLVGVAVWNRMLSWINPNLELDAEEDVLTIPGARKAEKIKSAGKSWIWDRDGLEKLLAGGNGHLEQQGGLAERLLDTYGNSILRLAYSYLHNYSDAEDILQETLIRYLQNIPKVAGPVHEKAWLLKVAANLSKNRIDYNRLRDHG